MIRSWTRNAAIERSFPVGVYHPTTLAFRHRKELILVHALPCGSSSRLTFSTTTRIFASPPPTLSPSTSKTSSPTPPLPKPPGKPKVDLRPGPIKAPTSTLKSQSTEAPASSSAPTSSLQASNTVESEKKVDAKEGGKKAEPGIIEATKEDYDKAIEHGILAPPPANAGRVGKLYHQAKEIFKFYFNGIKLVNTNRKRANEMKERVQAGGSPLTRWETKFIETTNNDMLKLIPFVAIVVVLEEIIPLIVLYAPGMLPSTCILRSQHDRIETKRRAKQRSFAEAFLDEFASIKGKEAKRDGERVGLVGLDQVSSEQVALCGILSISTMGPPFARRKRLERHLKKLIPDDILLQQEGMGERLTRPELLEALEERAIVADPAAETRALAQRLRWWLENVGGPDMSEADAVARRIALVARSGLGQF